MTKQEIKEVLNRKMGWYTKYMAEYDQNDIRMRVVGDWNVKVHQFQHFGVCIDYINCYLYKGDVLVKEYNKMRKYKIFDMCVGEFTNIIDRDINK